MDKQAVLFDLDGTVIDSKEGIFNALYYTFDKLGMKHPQVEIMNKFIGPSIGSSFMTQFSFTPEDADNAVSIYREYYSTKGVFECTLYDGISELVSELKAANIKVGLATKKPESFAKIIMKNFQLDSIFDSICGSDLVEKHDSKAHIIKHCATLLSSKADLNDVVMVGDTKYDIIGSHEAKVDSIGVLYGYGTRDELIKYNATYIVKTMSDLRKLLLQPLA